MGAPRNASGDPYTAPAASLASKSPPPGKHELASRIVLGVEALVLLAPMSVIVAGFVYRLFRYDLTHVIAPDATRRMHGILMVAAAPVLLAAWWVTLRFIAHGRSWLARPANWSLRLFHGGVVAILVGLGMWALLEVARAPFGTPLGILLFCSPLIVPFLHVELERWLIRRATGELSVASQ